MAISPLDTSSPRPLAEPLSSAPKASAALPDDASAPEVHHSKPFASDAFSFWDLVDIVNPLQHIPVVSTLYRHLTGDEIGYVAKLAGGALLGGALGLVGSFIDVAIEDKSGADIGEHVYALLTGEDAPNGDTALAQNEAAPAKAAADTPSPPSSLSEVPLAPDFAPPSRPSFGLVLPDSAAPVQLAALTPSPEVPLVPDFAPPTKPSFGLALPDSTAPVQLAALTPDAQTTALKPLLPRAEPRFMPLPQRGVPSPGPRVSPSAQGALLDAQTAASAEQPMISPTTMASTPEATNESGESGTAAAPGAWFGSAMRGALSKYEQARKLQVP